MFYYIIKRFLNIKLIRLNFINLLVNKYKSRKNKNFKILFYGSLIKSKIILN